MLSIIYLLENTIILIPILGCLVSVKDKKKASNAIFYKALEAFS